MTRKDTRGEAASTDRLPWASPSTARDFFSILRDAWAVPRSEGKVDSMGAIFLEERVDAYAKKSPFGSISC